MRRHAAPRVKRHGRWVRGLWPDRNPLRRAADRVEAAIVAGLLAIFVVGAPLAALAAGRWFYAAGFRVEHAQQSSWRQVPATLLATAPYPGYTGYETQVPARWTAPNGTRVSGEIPAPAGARVGSTLLVWVDASDRAAAAAWPGDRPGRPRRAQRGNAGAVRGACRPQRAGEAAARRLGFRLAGDRAEVDQPALIPCPPASLPTSQLEQGVTDVALSVVLG